MEVPRHHLHITSSDVCQKLKFSTPKKRDLQQNCYFTICSYRYKNLTLNERADTATMTQDTGKMLVCCHIKLLKTIFHKYKSDRKSVGFHM